MVTSNGLRAASVTALAVGGMLLGFYVQDLVKHHRLERIERRVEEEVAKRRALMAAKESTGAFAGSPTEPKLSPNAVGKGAAKLA